MISAACAFEKTRKFGQIFKCRLQEEALKNLIKTPIIVAGSVAVAIAAAGVGQAADKITACLITKTDINPFFVKMKEGALAKADELGMELLTFAGKIEGDHEGQVQAVETCIASGAKGILITVSDTKAMSPTAQLAKDNGVLFIALDTPLEPIEAADSTFMTDNFEAGRLIGAWAKSQMGDAAKDAKVAFLNIADYQPTVGVLRNQGFMTGFGIDTKDISKWGDEDDPRIAGQDVTLGNEEGGRTAMETLLQKEPGINLIYTINEPAAAGAYEALKAVGREKDVLITSVDGGCPGVKDVAGGVIGATSQQYPLLMASLGMEAIKVFADTGNLPENTEGKNYFHTGVTLITDKPVDGVPSVDTKEGLALCWG